MNHPDPGFPTREDVARWTPQERARVARMLDELLPRPARDRRGPRRRLLVLVVTIGGAVVLFPWVAYLSVTLPATATGGAWRTAWVGYDAILAVALAAAGWLVWHRRQLALVALAVAATLLIVDAWFDVSLSWGTSEQWGAVVTAAAVELPVAAVLIAGATGLLRRTMAVVRQLRGQDDRPPSLWKQPVVLRPPGGRS
jgi:hypothetical protein